MEGEECEGIGRWKGKEGGGRGGWKGRWRGEEGEDGGGWRVRHVRG